MNQGNMKKRNSRVISDGSVSSHISSNQSGPSNRKLEAMNKVNKPKINSK